MKKFLIVLPFLALLLGASDSLRHARAYSQTITTSAVAVSSTVDGFAYKSCLMGNPSATPVYLGGPDLTVATGFPICTDTAVCTRADIAADFMEGAVYAMVSSGSPALKTFCGK